MKKIVFIISFLVIIVYSMPVYGEINKEIITEQEKKIEITDFISEASKYTKSTFEDFDLSKTYNDALSGNIDTKGIIGEIVKLAGTEVQNTLKTIGYIFIIIIIHSIIKSISEGVGNGEIGEITYYVQYILIVTLIMTNFADIIVLIKNTVNNLVGFLNSLLPILISLIVITGNIVTATAVQPILLFVITFIRKYDFLFIYTINTNWHITWNSIENIR